MRTKERTYIIKKGDTLQKVAQELAIPPMELRRYHNIYCEIPDLIEADFPSHLELLLLPPEEKALTENGIIEKKQRKVSFAKGYALPFLPAGSHKNYDIKYILEEGDQIDTLEFQVSLTWLAMDQKGFHLFEINKSNSIYINNVEPNTIMDELAAKTAKCLYPLQVVVDANGKWVDVYNHNEILDRWEKIKTELLEYYEGEVSQIHIKHTDQNVETKANLMTALSSDYFLRSFFNGIHVAYTPEYTFENSVTFPLIKEEEALFKVQQTVEPYLEDFSWIKVEQKGDYVDTDFDIDFGFDPWEGNYSAIYFLNPDTYCVEKIELECIINYDTPIKTTITIESIEEEEKPNNMVLPTEL